MGLTVEEAVQSGATHRWHGGGWQPGQRLVAAETAVSFSYNRLGHAVMMATPADLEDFATGFSLAEGIVAHPGEIEELEVIQTPLGIELRMWIDVACLGALETRRRRLAGPTGCGMCGLESLAQATRSLPPVSQGPCLAPADITAAMASLAPAQRLHGATRAMHAAGFWQPGLGLLALREDVGRHNALDKLAGAMARGGIDASTGVLALTSRVSVELVQKAARMGACVLAAISAPTALALQAAEAVGLTVIGVARDDGFEVFTGAHRLGC
jgi:FdhD protein